jgi:hypothetical protein
MDRISTEGRCLCGAHRYQITGSISGMVHCHCSRCRKHHGASFGSFFFLGDGALRWLAGGGSRLGGFASSHGGQRCFCRTCGSTLPEMETGEAPVAIAGNLLDAPPAPHENHIYTGSKAPWVLIPGEQEQFTTVPERWSDPHLAPLERPVPKLSIAGSCLCGDIRFEAADPAFMMNCHCSRCRLSRAAAHATNLFVPRDALRWISGEAQVVNYKLPDAERFGVGFCERCGSLVPRTSSASDFANIPAGCLDADPGITPTGHIYLGSKARWFSLLDDLPIWEASWRDS